MWQIRPCFPTVIALYRYRRAEMPSYVCASSATGGSHFRKLKTLRADNVRREATAQRVDRTPPLHTGSSRPP
jgi:hypothetical protein